MFPGRGGWGYVTFINTHLLKKNIQKTYYYSIHNNYYYCILLLLKLLLLEQTLLLLQKKKILFWTVFNLYHPKPPPTTQKFQIPYYTAELPILVVHPALMRMCICNTIRNKRPIFDSMCIKKVQSPR